MLQFQNDFLVIELVNNATAITLTWKGYIPSPVYREGLEKALEIAVQHNISNWISDIRLMNILDSKDREWAKSVWVPKAVSTGFYKKQAVIMAMDIFAGASARSILSAVPDQQVETKNFTSLEAAKKWLLTD
ncbi:hypothetical protein [Cesiribacter sp. SM1]|uniref:hypothetical protein n=1 Tax=Cesiribacter sp. SM1 TaxID=2861196 RepID=UPI001CD1DBB8|nr:hypothetical protein [Cesiribacter sp. SM1]